MKPAEALFPWDPGRSRHLPRPLSLQLKDELVLKGGGDVMGSQQPARADGLIVRPSYLYKFNYLCICNLY
jgi:hypothetical protein